MTDTTPISRDLSSAGFSHYRHIIWDWNGTLFDDAWLCLESMNKVLARRSMAALTASRYVEIFEFPVINYYRTLGFDFDRESFEISGSEFIREYNARNHQPDLQKGVRGLLEEVAASGRSQSLLSAQEQKTLEKLVARFNIDHLFNKIIGLDNHYAFSKIDSGKRWVDALPHTPDEILFVGDTKHDAEVAGALGCDCILIPSGHQSRQRLEEAKVPVMDSLEQLSASLFTGWTHLSPDGDG